MTKIGVFDSGVGGQSVVNAIQSELRDATLLYFDDKAHLPYGDKSPDELYTLVLPILKRMVHDGCEVIVIACNTVTTNIIDRLRHVLPVPLIGLEPMVKPAAQLTKTGVIAVCATPATLKSKRYHELKQQYASGLTVIEPDCSDWAYMIESQQLDHQKIEQCISEVCRNQADVIVLGCTHYHWIQQEIQSVANRFEAKVINPEEAVVSRLRQVLGQL